ncbi:MAG TPA: PKD domain-containing protein, partial [Chitinophagaceae bacterium]|nr:PKD domain-containing protein [Chitinophagaceae bacterium]
MTFKDASLGTQINNWTWYFGDGTTGAGQNAVHAYAGGDAVYSVKLVIGDAFGCSDSVTRPNYVTIKKPKPAFGVKDSTTICPPLETQFFFQGKDYESYFWDFGDGGTSSLPNPTHFFNTYGTDTVKLYLVGYGGCLDSATSLVNLYNPYTYTKILYNPPQPVCNTLNVDFTVITPPSTKSYFYFGDGAVDSSQQSQLHHFYSTPSYNSPLAILTDSTGCIVNVGGPTTIVILGAEPIFAMDQKRFCDSGIVSFTNLTVKNDPLVNEIWNFGDGTTITIPDTSNAIHNFRQPGLYVTSLTANTQAGCTKTLTDTVRVLRTPDPSITSADAACVSNLVSFQGNLAVPDTAISWKWDFGNGQTSTQPQALISYSTPGPYTIHATAANSLGCKDTTSTSIIINPLPSVTITGDTTLLVGLGITMPVAYSSNVVSYSWTPATHLSCTDCATPYADPKFTTTYRVTATDSNGCVSSREITLITLCNNKNFFIPNTFSPNKDGMNDVFYPRGKGIDRIEALRIFNRWGELVFEKRYFPANDPTAGWDGTYKGKPSNTDTYIYMIDIICENALIVTYKGNVTLIR